ncbi:FAD-dependent oxidoreductase [Weissella koreensis]|uniref:FAD-dependent oxidoreductase n=1 Tax=Weissella koreensis TaxID=165096 RepID=A0A7H1MKC1_9LACO|nr:FAD-dependent oxidoreductase [Weissella koreensis]AVH74648.1 FAD-dependent oxidoreductase [Weissella koreensis]EJF34003.1 NAD(FAD)-dependent dehydrogenase [Weissella koreensis KCTC 3621]EJF34293.1 NAD(FAD)-dependent dehydrogenase [Weissella koreensis KCTC 3621]MCZ9310494.1 FAD-dependent oxidoreductase [Weissella koreensis]QGN19872.1 FAD-dependent oxidoreductase [Weissella koreensis]
MKVAIIGCTHAGIFSARGILETDPTAEITVFEKNDTVSFLSCGIALWVGNHVSDPEKMFYDSVEAMKNDGIDMKMQHEVTNVDLENKVVTYQNLENQQEKTEKFDKIVVTTGSKPVMPPIPGINGKNIYLCKNWDDAKAINEAVKDVKSAIVIGAGYIGAEIAEQFSVSGIKTTLIDGLDRVLAKNFDKDITDEVEIEYQKHDVTLGLGQMVQAFESTDDGVKVTTDKGSYEADIVVLGIGFLPRTDLFTGQVDMIKNGAIIVDKYMQTSVKDVYAAGDSATVFYNPTQQDDYIPLATNAVRQGILVGKNILKPTVAYLGTQATSAVELYGKAMASSGLNQQLAQARGIEGIKTVTIEQDYRPDFMLTTTPVRATLVWDENTRAVLGGSFYSEHDISQTANALSLAIQNKMTIDELALSDFLFQPNFSQPINFLGAVAMAAAKQ